MNKIKYDIGDTVKFQLGNKDFLGVVIKVVNCTWYIDYIVMHKDQSGKFNSYYRLSHNSLKYVEEELTKDELLEIIEHFFKPNEFDFEVFKVMDYDYLFNLLQQKAPKIKLDIKIYFP